MNLFVALFLSEFKRCSCCLGVLDTPQFVSGVLLHGIWTTRPKGNSPQTIGPCRVLFERFITICSSFTSYKRFSAVWKLKCLNKVYKRFSAVFMCLNKVYESSASTFAMP